jgi:hypothetical protein
MVELEPEDYSEILNWFTHKYGMEKDVKQISDKAVRVFWKLTFLAEDKIKEIKDLDPKDEKGDL